jgi:hypothetical protein
MAIPLEGASNKDGAAEFLQYIVFEQEARNLFELAGFTIVGVPGQPDPGK